MIIRQKISLIKTWLVLFSDKVNRAQFLNPKNIPFIIINYNQLFYLQKLVAFAQAKGFKKIVIIDNTSTYPPLLEFYEQIEKTITIERMKKNYGHMVFFENADLYAKYGKNFFILTDADIEPNKNLPKKFMRKIMWLLLKYYQTVHKVGFALKLDDIPSSFPARDKVIKWEEKFWEKEVEKNVFEAGIDTTFALYKPNPARHFKKVSNFFLALRIAGNYSAKHGGWYKDYNNLSDEEKYYQETTSEVSSWNIDKKGNLNESYQEKY